MNRWWALALFAVFGCAQAEATGYRLQATGREEPTASVVKPEARNPKPQPSAAASASVETLPGAALSHAQMWQLVTSLSEPDAEFITDNVISNETSYLQVAEQLPKVVAPGGVYLGVGPEQNFSYIALARPAYAYVVDIRRGNMLEQLLYKAIFDATGSRAELLAQLIAHPLDKSDDPGPDATVEQVMAAAEKRPAEKTTFDDVHAALLERITKTYGFELDAGDRRMLRKIHKSFAKRGLDLRFELKEKSFRKYPSLRELLAEKSPDGRELGFLASEAAFRYVQRMERENRVVPLVGDFAGDRALPGLAKHLKDAGQTVSAFYVSNVEQYLMTGAVWWKWRRNIEALPTDASSVFVRAYLDQGQHHPLQLPGHRTTTTVHRMAEFVAHKGRYPSMLALASSDVVK